MEKEMEESGDVRSCVKLCKAVQSCAELRTIAAEMTSSGRTCSYREERGYKRENHICYSKASLLWEKGKGV
jgi:hypothetical protein